MLVDGRSIPGGSVIETDCCVVGGGPAGITLALRLAELSGARVLVLESGGLEFDPFTQALARGETVGLPYYPLHETRVRLLGGSSQSWGGICTPLEPAVFEPRPWLGLPGWPIGGEALRPFLPAALERCGIAPDRQDADGEADAARRAAWPLDSSRIEPVLVHFSRPTRFGTAYLDELAKSSRITVNLHSTAVELLAPRDRRAVESIRVRTIGGGEHEVRARQIVLAGGGIENARLLLASRGRDVAGLANGHDQLGRWFMEHPRVPVRYRVRPGRTRLSELVGGGASGTLRFLRIGLARETQEREGLLSWHANVSCGYLGHHGETWAAVRRLAIALRTPWNESPFFQDGGGGRTRVRSSDLGAVLRRPHAAALGVMAAVRPSAHLRRWVEIYSATEQRPDPGNRIELTGERDPLGVPRVRITWRVGLDEERTHRRAMELTLAEFERIEPGIARRPLDREDPWPGEIVGTWHHLGGTRMAASPRDGVVDGDLRVHGVDNVSVVGSSVFPAAGSAAPTVTVVALALRLAEHLAGRLEIPAPAVGIRPGGTPRRRRERPRA